MNNQVSVYMRLGAETATKECNVLMLTLAGECCLDELKVLHNSLKPKACIASLEDRHSVWAVWSFHQESGT